MKDAKVFPANDASRAWAKAARSASIRALAAKADPGLRHGGTWQVGLDLLPNGPDGAVDGVPFEGPWAPYLPAILPLHRGQVSIVYPGYPLKDRHESDASHRYRRVRMAAHVDGLLPLGPSRRRYALEYHAYILGVHLNDCAAAPTVYWPGSHKIIAEALREAIGTRPMAEIDVTEAYQSARREVFASGAPVPLVGTTGESFLLHRFTLHGTAPWGDAPTMPEGRMIAFFRPVFPRASDWFEDP